MPFVEEGELAWVGLRKHVLVLHISTMSLDGHKLIWKTAAETEFVVSEADFLSVTSPVA